MVQETCIPIEEACVERGFARPELKKPADGANAGSNATHNRCIALVESRTFLRECVSRVMQAALSLPIATFSTPAELESQFSESIALVLLSLADARKEESAQALKVLSALDPSVPVVVLATVNDVDAARAAISLGAKGYIPCSTNFEIAVEALRFVLAGGTYLPADDLLAANPPTGSKPKASQPTRALSQREARIAQAIREGKSNKAIAYQLCICEGTVKVHLRHIMKKLKAKNRTDIAMITQQWLASE
jgi:DNA-binding NarL/FixJ family response regulator